MSLTRASFASCFGSSFASVAVAALAIASCHGAAENPSTVWIAPNGSELAIQLVDTEPPAF